MALLLSTVPFYALGKRDAFAAKTVQRAANSQINLALAQLLDQLQVVEVSPAAGVGDRDAAPLGQALHQLLVDALLEPLVVGGVDEEL